MAKHSAELELRLDDKVSRNMREVQRNLREMDDQNARQQRSMDMARGRMLDAAAIGWVAYEALRAPTSAAVEFQEQLTQIGFKADLTREKLAAMGEELRAQGLVSSRGAANMAKSVDVLMGKGLSPEQSMAAAEQISYAAAAYGIAEEDLANAIGALLLNGGITFDQIGLALDMMTKSGKLGQVEIANMAAEFPELVTAAAAFGYTGMDGLRQYLAWLQLAREGTATASEAVTNLGDFMMKLQMPDVQENFAGFGIDLEKELADAKARGADPILHARQLIQSLVDKGVGLGELFGEKNALMFLNTALPKYEKALQWQQDLVDSQGTVQTDFKKWMETPAGVFARLNASVENLNLVVGDTIVPRLQAFAEAVTPMIDGIAEFTQANGKLVSALLEMVAGIVALRVAAAGLGFAGAFMGLGKGGARPGAPLPPGGKPPAGAAPAGGGGFMDLIKPMSAWLADEIGTKVFDAINGEGATAQSKAITDGALERTVQRLQELWASRQGTDTGAAADRMATLRADIERIEAAQLPVTPPELGFMKAELEQLEIEAAASGTAAGQAIAENLGAQQATMEARLGEIISAMRVLAAAGITIPIKTSGPAQPRAATTPGEVGVSHFATGGWVNGPGSGTSDSVPAMLSAGEFVVNSGSASRFGGLLEAMNAGYPVGDLLSAAGASRGAVNTGRPGGSMTNAPTFNITVQGVTDPQQFADLMMSHLVRETDRLYHDLEGGAQADLGWDIA